MEKVTDTQRLEYLLDKVIELWRLQSVMEVFGFSIDDLVGPGDVKRGPVPGELAARERLRKKIDTFLRGDAER